MSVVVLDDHLLRDLLAGSDVVPGGEVATTNLWYVRLCRSVVAARGSALTGRWTASQRQVLGRVLVTLPDDVTVVPMRELAWRMALLADAHGLSSLGAEAVAAAQQLGAALWVWAGDDGPRIRAAAAAEGVEYRVRERA